MLIDITLRTHKLIKLLLLLALLFICRLSIFHSFTSIVSDFINEPLRSKISKWTTTENTRRKKLSWLNIHPQTLSKITKNLPLKTYSTSQTPGTIPGKSTLIPKLKCLLPPIPKKLPTAKLIKYPPKLNIPNSHPKNTAYTSPSKSKKSWTNSSSPNPKIFSNSMPHPKINPF